MTAKIRYQPSGHVVLRTIGDDRLLVPMSGPAAQGRIYPLNETAHSLWTCLAEGGDLDRAVETVRQTYDVDEATARTDCETCLQFFVDERLMERVVS